MKRLKSLIVNNLFMDEEENVLGGDELDEEEIGDDEITKDSDDDKEEGPDDEL